MTEPDLSPAQMAPSLDEVPCLRVVVGRDGKRLTEVARLSGPARGLLGRAPQVGAPIEALLGEEGARALRRALTGSGWHPVDVVYALRGGPGGEEGRWLQVLAFPRGDWVMLLVTAASEDAQARRNTEIISRYLTISSDLALMFSFSQGITDRAVWEVAAQAVRRMAAADRASYFIAHEHEDDRIELEPAYACSSAALARQGEPTHLELGSEESVTELLARAGDGMLLADAESVGGAAAEAMRARGSGQAAFLPVVGAEAMWGLLVLEFGPADRAFLQQEHDMLHSVAAMVGATLDREVARERLERSEALSSSVINSIADGILIVDGDGRVTMSNPSADRMLAGVPVPENASRDPRRLPVDLLATAVDEDGTLMKDGAPLIREALRAGETVSGIALQLPQTDRDPLWLELSVQPLATERGAHPDVAVISFSDVSAQRRHEAALRSARDEALAASQLKSTFLANVSHDIRTPMNGIIGMATLLLESDLRDRDRRYAETLKDAAETLLNLLDDVLDLSKIEAGRLRIESVDLDPWALVEGVASILRGDAARKGIELRLYVDEALPSLVTGDPHRIRQVLLNLVGNAVKFTPEGSVEVRACLVDEEGGPRLRFEVEDTGIGMSEEQVSRVFQRFTQGDTSTTRRYGGSGLGLSISQELTELMVGRIGARSALGEGSCFFFEVPTEVKAEPPASPPRAKTVQQPDAAADAKGARRWARVAGEKPRARVLVVEDQVVNQLVARSMLELLGCEVSLARDGLEGVAAAGAGRFDLILMDVQMPELDGFEAARRIRAHEREEVASVPIVALSASALLDDRQACRDAGMNDFLAKPVRLEDLDKAVLRWVPEAAPAPASSRGESQGADPDGGGTPLVDAAVLERIRRTNIDDVSGGDQLLGELAELFTIEVDERLGKLEGAIEAGDAPAVRRHAHALKGSASTLGANALAERCRLVERLAADEDTAGLREGLSALKDLVDRTIVEMDRRLGVTRVS